MTAAIHEATNTRGTWTLAVTCPGCGHTHHHGGGTSTDAKTVRTFLGHRAAHCPTVCEIHGHHERLPGGYVLTDPLNLIGKAASL